MKKYIFNAEKARKECGNAKWIDESDGKEVEFPIGTEFIGFVKVTERPYFALAEQCDVVDDSESGTKIVISVKDNKTFAELFKDGKAVKTAEARCNPSDEFDFGTGAKLAIDRLFEKEAEKQKFTKSDLQNGDVVVKRNGCVEILCNKTLITKFGFNSLDSINDDLTSTHGKDFDIMKVYRPTKQEHTSFDKYKCGDLVFKRA